MNASLPKLPTENAPRRVSLEGEVIPKGICRAKARHKFEFSS